MYNTTKLCTLLSGIQDHPQISDHTENKSKKNKRPHLNKQPGGIFLKLVKSDQIEIIDYTFEKNLKTDITHFNLQHKDAHDPIMKGCKCKAT